MREDEMGQEYVGKQQKGVGLRWTGWVIEMRDEGPKLKHEDMLEKTVSCSTMDQEWKMQKKVKMQVKHDEKETQFRQK